MIGNAEIHIVRADPARHNGRNGFLYAITWGRERRDNPQLWLTRVAAAVAAADHLDRVEAGLD